MAHEVRDHVCEMSIKRLFEARERRDEYSFIRYIDDIRDRLEIEDNEALWQKYGKYLNEKF